MGKNKNKKKNKLNNLVENQIEQVKPFSVYLGQINNEIERINRETQNIEPVEVLSEENSKKVAEFEEKNDLKNLYEYIKQIFRRLEGKEKLLNEKERKLDEKETKIQREAEEIEKIKLDLENKKKELNEKIEENINKAKQLKLKIEEYNKKDKELMEREFALDNGEYSGIIRRLLDSLKETEKQIMIETENLIKELHSIHKQNINELLDYNNKLMELEKKERELQRKEVLLDISKKSLEEKTKEDLEFEFNLKYRANENLIKQLQIKNQILNDELKELRRFYDDILNTFGSVNPNEILNKHKKINDELIKLKLDLDKRPDPIELQILKHRVEELELKLEEYKEKYSETELLKLKNNYEKLDTYKLEINSLKNQIETYKYREEMLKQTIEDLRITIDQLKGEVIKNSETFEFASKCDRDQYNLGINHLSKKVDAPNDLLELAIYVQNWMAFNPEKPFYYSLDTIKIFIAGLHMSYLTILQGISGTGKTSLPREFAKALINDENYKGINEDNEINAPFRICSIQSGWRDNMDLIGYYNSFEHKYKETDFFKALYVANLPKYSDTLFLIILDEMNLSRPEHYFADFLSLLEQPNDEWFITLVNIPLNSLPKMVKNGRLKIPKNVRFVGTANHDETTLEFAPKTYDRSNIIEMPKNHPNKSEFKRPSKKFNVAYSWLYEKFLEAENKNKKYCEKFYSFLEISDFKSYLNEVGIGIGNRFENQAEKFISVFVEMGENKEKELAIAADHLITSRLFRTIKNRYDLDKNFLSIFKEDYVKLFNNIFKYNPKFAEELLETEIRKK